MKVTFEELPETAKVWVYQSSEPFSNVQLNTLQQFTDVFLSQWESHTIPVQGSIDVVNERFVRVAAFSNEDSMCGRAQDAQVRLIKELEEVLGVELTNRMLIVFNTDEGDRVVHLQELPEIIESSEINPTTVVYNNLVSSKGEFLSGWKVPAGQTWLERYF